MSLPGFTAETSISATWSYNYTLFPVRNNGDQKDVRSVIASGRQMQAGESAQPDCDELFAACDQYCAPLCNDVSCLTDCIFSCVREFSNGRCP
jgi:hypothetical protein